MQENKRKKINICIFILIAFSIASAIKACYLIGGESIEVIICTGFIYAFTFKEFRTEDYSHQLLRKVCKALLYIGIVAVVVGFINTNAQWLSGEALLKCMNVYIAVIPLIEAFYLFSIRTEVK